MSGNLCVNSFFSVLLKLILSLVFLFLVLPFPDFYYFSCALVSEVWFPDNLPRFCCTDKRVKHCDNRHHCCYEKYLIWFCPNTTFSWGYIWSFWKCLILIFFVKFIEKWMILVEKILFSFSWKIFREFFFFSRNIFRKIFIGKDFSFN